MRRSQENSVGVVPLRDGWEARFIHRFILR